MKTAQEHPMSREMARKENGRCDGIQVPVENTTFRDADRTTYCDTKCSKCTAESMESW